MIQQTQEANVNTKLKVIKTKISFPSFKTKEVKRSPHTIAITITTYQWVMLADTQIWKTSTEKISKYYCLHSRMGGRGREEHERNKVRSWEYLYGFKTFKKYLKQIWQNVKSPLNSVIGVLMLYYSVFLFLYLKYFTIKIKKYNVMSVYYMRWKESSKDRVMSSCLIFVFIWNLGGCWQK